MATRNVASWVTSISYDDLPEVVRDAAERSLYNYIGCAIHGSSHEAVVKASSALRRFFGAGTSCLLGNAGSSRTDALHAALLNGMASHVHDYDDTHLETVIHPTGPVASAILAYADTCEGPVSGRDVLTAVVAGIEVECKVGLAVWPSHYDIGWHISSTVGSIGAAVAVGKLMKLESAQMANAVGIAATQVTGLREMFGSDTKAFHIGRAAQNGLTAAVLAASAFTSSPQALEAQRGWANVVLGSDKQPKMNHYVGQLGKVWEIEKNSFKPFPCGIVCHPVIDASIRIHSEVIANSKDPKAAAMGVRCMAEVHPLVLELTSKKNPKDGLEAKFSVFHGAAVGLLFGKAGPSEYEHAVVCDDEVARMRDRIEVSSNIALRPDEALVKYTVEDGESHEVMHIEHAVGSIASPMSKEKLTQKFMDQVSLEKTASDAQTLSDEWWSIAACADIRSLTKVT